MLGVWYAQALNFFALGVFSPFRYRSAPTFFPLLGHPLFCEQARKKDTAMIPNVNLTAIFFINKYM
jgi:hypothetical protein